MFAIKHYDNPQAVGEKEFYDDMKRFKYLKRLFKKHSTTGILKERLIMNHIIVLQNVFGPEAVKVLLFFKIGQEHWSVLKTFLLFLNYMTISEMTQISIDVKLMETLKGIYGEPQYVSQIAPLGDEELTELAGNLKGGVPMGTPVFDGAHENDVVKMLEQAGLDSTGQVALIDGRTGEAFERNSMPVVGKFSDQGNIANASRMQPPNVWVIRALSNNGKDITNEWLGRPKICVLMSVLHGLDNQSFINEGQGEVGSPFSYFLSCNFVELENVFNYNGFITSRSEYFNALGSSVGG